MYHRLAVSVLTSLVACLSLFAQEVPNLVGDWLGVIEMPGVRLRLALAVTTGPNGLKAKLTSVDQGNTALPVDTVSVEGNKVQLQLVALQASYQGEFDDDGEEIVGTWTQRGHPIALNLQRVASAPVHRRPQEPKPPFPYDEREVSYRNEGAGITLAGTLTTPKGEGPFPAVLLITGSGPQDRDEAVAGHRPFFVIADAFTRKGIAVLRVDDRGVGGSTGGGPTATSADFADDVLAGVAFLRSQHKIDANRVGLLGHSEGALIAPMAAAKDPRIAFLVLLAPPAVTGDKLLLVQAEAVNRASGVHAAGTELNRHLQLCTFDIVKSAESLDMAAEQIRSRCLPLDGVSESNRAAAMKAFEPHVRMATTPWFRFLLMHDPAPILRSVKVPVIAMFGAKDLQVVASQNAPVVEEILKQSGHSASKVVVLPNLNHLMQTAETGVPKEYGEIEETIAPAALAEISTWLEVVTKAEAPPGAR